MRLLARVAVALLVLAGPLYLWLAPRKAAPETAAPTLALLPDPARSGFARAEAPRQFQLPRDHGPHFEFETEWWYYTGNLESRDGRAIGFQLTFFRRGLSPAAPPPGPGLRTNQIYFAHLALTDVAGRRHRFFERWSRGAAGLAGATGEPFRVWLEDWRAEGLAPDASTVRIEAGEDGFGIDLRLGALKPLVRHGDRGLSPKSTVPGNASFYIGYTRMKAEGRVRLDGAALEVQGAAWFDHEWSTSALGEGAVGWDWWSLQMADGRDFMYFRIRRSDGSVEPASGGTLIAPDGRERRLTAADVDLEVLDRWTSPDSGAVYPVRWRLRSTPADLDLVVDRRLDAQEMRTSFTYWEGAVTVQGTSAGRPTNGVGYVELTGYAGSMQGVF